MTSHWDEFSKSLVEESVPRRESLRRLGVVLAGAVLSPLGLGAAWARGPDPCKSFCRCRRKSDQSQCLAACRACATDGGRLCGSCGNYHCADLMSDIYNCGACGYQCNLAGNNQDTLCVNGHCEYPCVPGTVSCGDYCADLANDPHNCGACGYLCEEPGPYEYGACISGNCEYACAEGAVYCNGFCTFLGWDHYNCGGCGNVCPGSAPYCNEGVCICPSGMAVCDGQCVDILRDPDNCGACGTVCPSSAPYCKAGVCVEQLCAPGLTWCHYGCVNLSSDPYNCGACGHQCGSGDGCSGGNCTGLCVGCY